MAALIALTPEYVLAERRTRKHAAQYASGTKIVVLEPDVASESATADEVNKTLRAVARLLPDRRSRSKHKLFAGLRAERARMLSLTPEGIGSE
jgi:hypothetical protein